MNAVFIAAMIMGLIGLVLLVVGLVFRITFGVLKFVLLLPLLIVGTVLFGLTGVVFSLLPLLLIIMLVVALVRFLRHAF